MTILYRSKTLNYGLGNSGYVSGQQYATHTINKPANVAAGDVLMVIFASSSGVNPIGATLAGWTNHQQLAIDASGGAVEILTKIAGASEPASYAFQINMNAYVSSGNNATVYMVAYRNDAGSAFVRSASVGLGKNTDTPFPGPSAVASTDKVVRFGMVEVGSSTQQTYVSPNTGAGYTVRQSGGSGSFNQPWQFDENPDADLGAPTSRVMGTGGYGNTQVATVILGANVAPNAPTLTSLQSGEVIDRAAANRATHTFSDPDTGDSQSAFDHRYRLIGAATWTTAYVTSPNGYVDYPAGTFAAGDYERQVRTYDAQGVAGPWSASGFFTAADAPAMPTITDPIQNETVPASRDVTWTAAQQDAYQLQVLDGGVAEYDTGVVVSTARTVSAVPFPDNNVTRAIRVRVRYGGLWSSWYTIGVTVSYTKPPVPVVSLQGSLNRLIVQVTNPAPGAGEPTVVQNEVLITEDGTEERRAILAPNSSWTYWLPRSGLDYDQLVRVEAIGDNGTRSSS